MKPQRAVRFHLVHIVIAVGVAACAAYVVYSVLMPVATALQTALAFVH